jgi:hypothetical protein
MEPVMSVFDVLDASLRVASLLTDDLRNAAVDLSNYTRELDSLQLVLREIMESLVSDSVLNKSNKSNLAFGFDLNLIREVEI